MAYKSGFFTDQKIYANDFNDMVGGLISNGVLGSSATNAQVIACGGMVVGAQAGYIWVNGHWIKITSTEQRTVTTADGVLNRIDRYIARINLTENTGELLLIKGTLSSTPTAPALVRDGTYYDLGLATIYVEAGTTEITQAMITDTRGDSSVCGYVYALAQEIDTTGLFAQYDAKLTQLIEDMGESEHVDVIVNSDAVSIQSVPVTLTSPTTGQALVFGENGNIVNGVGGLTEKDVFAVCADDVMVPVAYPYTSSISSFGMIKAFIPKSVKALPTKFLAFAQLREAVFEEGSNIEDLSDAFYCCYKLEKITIPDSVKQLSNSVFYQCSSLIAIVIPPNVQSIGNSCFYGTAIENIEIPSEVKRIEQSTFYNCAKLNNVVLHNGLEYIADGAFGYCSNLSSLSIPDSIKQVGQYAFCAVSSYYDFAPFANTVATGIQYIDGKIAWRYVGTMPAGTSITFNVGTLVIADSSFRDKTQLINVSFPTTLKTIGEWCFSAVGITTLVIPEGIENILNYAFYASTNLSSITLPSTIKEFGLAVFSGTSWYNSKPDGMIYLNKVAYEYKGTAPSSLTIQSGTKVIAGNCFSNKTTLTSIILPPTVEYIGQGAFSNTGITSITIPPLVKVIKYGAFQSSKLTQIDIPNTVEELETYVFSNCTSLIVTTISNSVKKIGSYVFNGCISLQTINLYSNFAISSLDLKDCPLTSPCIADIANKIVDRTGNIPYTIKFKSTAWNAVSDSIKKMYSDKNWTVTTG